MKISLRVPALAIASIALLSMAGCASTDEVTSEGSDEESIGESVSALVAGNFRLMTFNIAYGKYMHDASGKSDLDKLVALIHQKNPDVLFMQEIDQYVGTKSHRQPMKSSDMFYQARYVALKAGYAFYRFEPDSETSFAPRTRRTSDTPNFRCSNFPSLTT